MAVYLVLLHRLPYTLKRNKARLVFLCLTKTATESTERSRGRITNHDNSGTADVGVVAGDSPIGLTSG